MFNQIFGMRTASRDVLERYFSLSYVQNVNKATMGFDEFVSHIAAQKKVIASMEVAFDDFVIQGNKVAERHRVFATKKDGGTIEASVIAIWTIEGGKITRCDELTHMLKGSKEDEDLGERVDV